MIFNFPIVNLLFLIVSDIPKRGTLIRKISYTGCKDKKQNIDSLEHVQIHVKLEHPRRGDVNMFLVSPSGTRYVFIILWLCNFIHIEKSY